MGKKTKRLMTLCPCGSGISYDLCCAPYLQGEKQASTAETLMRSRYVAYAQGHSDYLMTTWHASTRPEALVLNSETNPRWIRLEIKQHQENGDRAIVEFIATYQENGRAQTLHETSRFILEGSYWYYVDGDIH